MSKFKNKTDKKEEVKKAIEETRKQMGARIAMLGMLGAIEDDPEMLNLVIKFFEDTIDLMKFNLNVIKPKKKKS